MEVTEVDEEQKCCTHLWEGQVQREDGEGKGELIRLKHESRCER